MKVACICSPFLLVPWYLRRYTEGKEASIPPPFLPFLSSLPSRLSSFDWSSVKRRVQWRNRGGRGTNRAKYGGEKGGGRVCGMRRERRSKTGLGKGGLNNRERGIHPRIAQFREKKDPKVHFVPKLSSVDKTCKCVWRIRTYTSHVRIQYCMQHSRVRGKELSSLPYSRLQEESR